MMFIYNEFVVNSASFPCTVFLMNYLEEQLLWRLNAVAVFHLIITQHYMLRVCQIPTAALSKVCAQ